MTAVLPIRAERRDRAFFVDLIVASHRRTVGAIFETGDLLIEAKETLAHGEFTAMVAEDLPFGLRMAEMYMAIARDARLRDAKRISHLPPSVGALYELSRLDDTRWARVEPFVSAAFKPGEPLTRKQVRQLARPRRSQRHSAWPRPHRRWLAIQRHLSDRVLRLLDAGIVTEREAVNLEGWALRLLGPPRPDTDSFVRGWLMAMRVIGRLFQLDR